MTRKEILRAMVYELFEEETKEQKEARFASMWKHHIARTAAKKKRKIEALRKGYVIIGEHKQRGLATVDGQQILPPIFAEIDTYEHFVIAANKDVDTLYAYDGTPLLEGTYWFMRVSKKTGKLTAETPYGTEIFDLRDFEAKMTALEPIERE